MSVDFSFFLFTSTMLAYLVIILVAWIVKDKDNFTSCLTLLLLAPWLSLVYAIGNIMSAIKSEGSYVLSSVILAYILYRIGKITMPKNLTSRIIIKIHFPVIAIWIWSLIGGITEQNLPWKSILGILIVAVFTFILYWKSLRMLQQAIREIEALERKQKQYG